MKTLQDLVKAEINFRIEYYACTDPIYLLGDGANGFKASKSCYSVEEGIAFLISEANRLYPTVNA